MKFESLRSIAAPIRLNGVKLKKLTGDGRRATMDLSISVRSGMFVDLPRAFKESLSLMQADVTVETIEIETVMENKLAKIYSAPDMKSPNLTILGMGIRKFSLERAEGIVTLNCQAVFEYQHDYEGAVWIASNLGNDFFWELEDMQPGMFPEVADDPGEPAAQNKKQKPAAKKPAAKKPAAEKDDSKDKSKKSEPKKGG